MTGLSPLIEIRNLTRIYNIGRTALHALKNVSLTIEPGEYVAVVGTSGSGKSTLLNILGLLDRPTEGTYRIHNQDAGELTDKQRTTLRNQGDRIRLPGVQPSGACDPPARQAELPLFYAGCLPQRVAPPRPGRPRPSWPGRSSRSQTGRVVRRTAPEGRHRPRPRQQPLSPPRRRANRCNRYPNR